MILLRVMSCLRPPCGVTREEVAKHFVCVLASFCEQKTYNVHADEGQPDPFLSRSGQGVHSNHILIPRFPMQ